MIQALHNVVGNSGKIIKVMDSYDIIGIIIIIELAIIIGLIAYKMLKKNN